MPARNLTPSLSVFGGDTALIRAEIAARPECNVFIALNFLAALAGCGSQERTGPSELGGGFTEAEILAVAEGQTLTLPYTPPEPGASCALEANPPGIIALIGATPTICLRELVVQLPSNFAQDTTVVVTLTIRKAGKAKVSTVRIRLERRRRPSAKFAPLASNPVPLNCSVDLQLLLNSDVDQVSFELIGSDVASYYRPPWSLAADRVVPDLANKARAKYVCPFTVPREGSRKIRVVASSNQQGSVSSVDTLVVSYAWPALGQIIMAKPTICKTKGSLVDLGVADSTFVSENGVNFAGTLWGILVVGEVYWPGTGGSFTFISRGRVQGGIYIGGVWPVGAKRTLFVENDNPIGTGAEIYHKLPGGTVRFIEITVEDCVGMGSSSLIGVEVDARSRTITTRQRNGLALTRRY